MRRVAWVLIFYALVAWAVVRGSDWLARVLALPPLFDTLLVGLLVVGVPVAVFLAWRLPELGVSGSREPPSPSEDSAGDEG